MLIPDPAEEKSGTEYEAVTVRNIVGSMCRCLNGKHYAKIFQHSSVRGLKEVLEKEENGGERNEKRPTHSFSFENRTR